MQSQSNNTDRPVIADRVLIWSQLVDRHNTLVTLAANGLLDWYYNHPFIGTYYTLANGEAEPHDVYCGDACYFVWS